MYENYTQILEKTNSSVQKEKSCKWDIICLLVSILAVLYTIFVVGSFMFKAYPYGEGGSANSSMKTLYDGLNSIGIVVYIVIMCIGLGKVNYIRCLNYAAVPIVFTIQYLMFTGPLIGFMGMYYLSVAFVVSIILFIIGVIKDCKN